MQLALEGQPDFPKILEALALASEGDGSLFALGASDSIPDLSNVWANVHTCNDQGMVAFQVQSPGRSYHVADSSIDFRLDTFENFQESFNTNELASLSKHVL